MDIQKTRKIEIKGRYKKKYFKQGTILCNNFYGSQFYLLVFLDFHIFVFFSVWG